MKAIVHNKYGSPDVLELLEIDKPVAKDDEVLVRVHAASVHPDVWHVVTGLPYVLRLMGSGVLAPKDRIPGTDMAGKVESIGKKVTQFRPGDEVFGETHLALQWRNGGAFAEYVVAPEDALALKPRNVSFEQAAAVPASGFIALQALRHEGQLEAGQKVLINGAGGGVGSIALQLAKAYGAHVTGVDDTEKLDMLRALGADEVIDYTRDDFTRRAERYDLIVDIPGNHSFADCRRALTPYGKYVLVGHDHFGKLGHRVLGSLPRFLKLMAMSLFVHQLPKMRLPLPTKKASIAVLKQFLEAGTLTPVIDRTYALAQVPEAIRYLREGRARGKIVVTM